LRAVGGDHLGGGPVVAVGEQDPLAEVLGLQGLAGLVVGVPGQPQAGGTAAGEGDLQDPGYPAGRGDLADLGFDPGAGAAGAPARQPGLQSGELPLSLGEVWSKPRDWRAWKVGEWVRITRRSPPRAVAVASAAVSPPNRSSSTGEQLLKDWLDCWNGRRSRGAAFTFVVTVPEEPGFIGVVGIAEGDDGAFEMTYGTAPGWRGRGLASRATRLAAQWVAKQPGVRTVETLIGQDQRASERVAVNAGFVLADTMTRSGPVTGQTVQLRYIMNRPA
jgi:RimJ/RimL family protein N-acetyltransferase